METHQGCVEFRYNGQYADDETGLIYLRNRYYDPSIGRFTQEDPYWNVNNMIYGDNSSNVPSYPAIAQSGNLYVYCMNDPVNGVDPWGYLNQGYDEYGNWHDWDAEQFGYSSAKYNMLLVLTDMYNSTDNISVQVTIASIADTLRATDTTIVDNVMLNDSAGAFGNGHNAALLLNPYGQGFYFSFYSESGGPLGEADMDFAILNQNEVSRLLDGEGYTGVVISRLGNNLKESRYDRFVWNDTDSYNGSLMFSEAVNIYSDPGTYSLVLNQCDNITNDIFSAGGAGYWVQFTPNDSYDVYSQNRTSWSNQLGAERGL